MTDKALPDAAQHREALIATALSARERAYAPYSNYKVGAAILTENGQITPGCNVENASYGLCNCAERTAIFTAACAGQRTVVAVAVATEDGGTPCGACRQVLAEFSPRDETPLVVLLLDREGTVVTETTLAALLPMAFVLR
ncbi:MAG: cytidine deaminase [Armatimonadota bacterium]